VIDARGWRAIPAAMVALALMACQRPPDSGPPAKSPATTSGIAVMPSASELDSYVGGAGAVHLGMTEDEVSAALGARPTQRRNDTAGWEHIGGERPGSALGQFVDGRLKRIEYAPSPWPSLPPVSRAAADSLLTGEYARRSYERTLGMSDIEAVTGGPGYRASWIIDGRAGPTVVASRWIWEVEPGKILYVSEEPGRRAGQPVIRDVPR
jgi:hypothetical protein